MRELRQYQKEGLEKISHFGGKVLLADQMGLGKSIQASRWVHNNKQYPLLIICPVSLKQVWVYELSELNKNIHVISGGSQYKLPKVDIVIINYDIVDKWKTSLMEYGFTSLVIDEGHYIKNMRSKRTKAILGMKDSFCNRIVLTGTPITRTPIDLYPLLKLLDVVRLSYFDFARKFCYARKTRWGWLYLGGKNLKELNDGLSKKCMIRRLKKDIDEIPKINRIPLCVDLTPEEKYEYDTIIYKIQIAKGKQVEVLEQVGILRRFIGWCKLNYVISYIKDFVEANPDEKLVVFTFHHKVIQELNRTFSKSYMIYGETKRDERVAIIEKFRSDKKGGILLASMQVLGVGVSLPECSNVLFAELDWLPSTHVQAESRCNRITSKEKLNSFYMFSRDTVEEKIIGKVLNRTHEAGVAIDGNSDKFFGLLD